MRRSLLSAAAWGALAAAIAGVAPATATAVPQGSGDAGTVPGRYIVGLDAQRSAVDGKTDRLARANGFRPRLRYRHALKGFAAALSRDQVARLRSDPDVTFVVPDRPIHARGAVPLAAGEPLPPPGIRRIGAATSSSAREAGTSGVAIVDTGIDLSHPDLNAVHGTNCMTPGAPAADGNGHGTHVAGTVAARNDGRGVVGVAPGTPVHAVKVLDDDGNGTDSSLICGLDWVLANARRLDIRVANLSLGGPGESGGCATDPLHQAVCRLTAAGVSLVVAAGNDAIDIAGPPADVPSSYPESLTVTAMADSDGMVGTLGALACGELDDAFASFSNYVTDGPGAGHTIAAPGACVRSTFPGGTYGRMSGTSMAAPHVAGAVALCLGEGGASGPCADLTPAQIVTRMRATAFDHATSASGGGFAGDPLRPASGGRYFGHLVWAGDATTAELPAPAPEEAATTPDSAPLSAATDVTPAAADVLAPAISLALRRVRLSALSRRGLPTSVRCSEACTIRSRLLRGRVVLSRRSTALAAAGRRSVRLRPRTSARRRLAGLRSVTLTVKVVVSDRAGNRRSLNRRVTLRR